LHCGDCFTAGQGEQRCGDSIQRDKDLNTVALGVHDFHDGEDAEERELDGNTNGGFSMFFLVSPDGHPRS
jgi:hypothetical protein